MKFVASGQNLALFGVKNGHFNWEIQGKKGGQKRGYFLQKSGKKVQKSAKKCNFCQILTIFGGPIYLEFPY